MKLAIKHTIIFQVYETYFTNCFEVLEEGGTNQRNDLTQTSDEHILFHTELTIIKEISYAIKRVNKTRVKRRIIVTTFILQED